jgi:regulator of nucleoside diphosphate kinase
MNMIAKRNKTREAFLLNQNDFDRLQSLVDLPRYRATHAASVLALKNLLNQSLVVAPAEVPGDVITMRSRVTVRDSSTHQSEEYTLAYPEEADIDSGKVSVLAPLGLAMLGKRVGDSVSFIAPLGTRQLKIMEIHYQPEAAGELYL